MGGEAIVVEGANIAQEKVEAVICRCLGLPDPEPEKKGIWGRLVGK
jgi:hypothetical protein